MDREDIWGGRRRRRRRGSAGGGWWREVARRRERAEHPGASPRISARSCPGKSASFSPSPASVPHRSAHARGWWSPFADCVVSRVDCVGGDGDGDEGGGGAAAAASHPPPTSTNQHQPVLLLLPSHQPVKPSVSCRGSRSNLNISGRVRACACARARVFIVLRRRTFVPLFVFFLLRTLALRVCLTRLGSCASLEAVRDARRSGRL